MSINELEAKISEMKQLQVLIEEAQQEVESLKDTIKEYMGESETLQAGMFRVTWKTVKTSRIDTVALKKALPDVAQAFTRESTTRRFTVA
ncbi:MAG: hypothetical protein LUD69_01620 [Oscillospiraceae bacterium]|nr:hypothetical protein [Oscillospiraceae bacterium]